VTKMRPYAWLLIVLLSTVSWQRLRAAEAPPPHTETGVDVVIKDEPLPRRYVLVEWQPLPLVVGQVAANLVVMPIEHHAIIISPTYMSLSTAPISTFDDAGNATPVAEQKFKGHGGEIGYRYYFGHDGPRGLFVGPSGAYEYFNETGPGSSKSTYHRLGLAADVGYQVLVADRVSLSLGGGVQYTWTNTPVFTPQFPANAIANGGFLPRLLLSLGVAL
jgi:hypothetical protein